MLRNHFFLLLCVLIALQANAFSFSSFSSLRPKKVSPPGRSHVPPESNLQQYIRTDSSEGIDDNNLNRRGFLSTSAAGAGFLIWNIPDVARAASTPEWKPKGPVVVLGAGGRTGMEVSVALAKAGIECVTTSRISRDPFQVIKLPGEVKSFITHYPESVNVVDAQGLEAAMKQIQPSAIIFCASASKQGGSAFQVDDEGVANAAKVAIANDARLVVVSALAVDRPASKSYQITNTLGGNLNGIMDAKRNGEEKVRSIMSKTKDYVIVRPGPLMSGKTLQGPKGIQLNQGDTVGGGLSRDELAGVVVGALTSGKKGITVEAYRASTAQVLEPGFAIPSGREGTGATYVELFSTVQSD